MNLKSIIKEEYNKIFEDDTDVLTQQEIKTQEDYDWRKHLPQSFKNILNFDGNNIILYHYGDDKGTGFLDPDKAETKDYTPDFNVWGKKRIFFYVDSYDKEPRVTGKEYIIKYPLDKLYPFNADPLYYKEECEKELNVGNLHPNRQLICIGNKAAERGFDGLISKWRDTLRVDLWVKVPVSSEKSK